MATGNILDPICDMVVSLDEARGDGLTVVHAGREYGFCSAGCRRKFSESSSTYVAKVDAWLAKASAPAGHPHSPDLVAPAIDAGIRAWYDSCRCCLSDAHPQLVEVLDRERAAAAVAPADAGICETAESHEA
jgi:YHS domain-containing protein